MNPENSYDYCTVYVNTSENASKGRLVVSQYSADEIEQEQISLDELGIYADNYIAKLSNDGWQLCSVVEHGVYSRTYYLQRFK